MLTTTEPTLTPYELEILLHYYWSPQAPINTERIGYTNSCSNLCGKELLVVTGGSWLKITPRGRAFVEHLLRQPLPICKWVVE